MLSPLAIPANAYGYRLFERGRRAVPLYGITVHTTGSGILDQSPQKTAAGTMARAVQYYKDTGGPTYVVGWDGKIVAIIADELMRGAHAGIGEADVRAAYAQNTWRSRVSPAGVARWQALWPWAKSPADLIPNRDPNLINDAFLGIEMIPITDGNRTYAQPMFPGAKFTREQHEAVRKLVHDIAGRHKFPTGWANKGSPRLNGHSDLDPITRDSPAMPLWDPGYASGAFDFNFIRSNPKTVLILVGVAVAGGVLVAYYLNRRRR